MTSSAQVGLHIYPIRALERIPGPVRGFPIPEGKKYWGKRRSTGRRALAATGLAATVAAAGVAAAPAGAAASGKLYACYSDKTKSLYYSKPGAKCAKGFTQISWNKQGPQGARGAQGATGPQGAQGAQGGQGPQGARGTQGAQGNPGSQGAQGNQGFQGAQGKQGSPGPAGAVAGYTVHQSNTSAPKGHFTVVASITPAADGYYATDGIAVISNGSGTEVVTCREERVNASGKSIAPTTVSADQTVPGGAFGDIATTGIIQISKSEKVLAEACSPFGHATNVYRAALTAVQLSTADVTTSAPTRPTNKFSLPKLRRTKSK